MISRIFARVKAGIARFSQAPQLYPYQGFAIELPPGHRLPQYRRRYANYDRFLPHLAGYLEDAATIVDIGANVGDSLAAMVERNPAANYICIEPDDMFHAYLERNAARIGQAVPGTRIRLVKALVGQAISNVSLGGTGGTKHAVTGGSGTISSQPFGALIPDAAELNIRLLKSDVDGFDYDVLDSALPIIAAQGPMLFFECYQTQEYQKAGYARTLRALDAAGYRDWTVFDNFGEVMLRTADAAAIDQLLDYIWKQNTGAARRTIYYLDVLAVREADSALIDRVLADYG
jgi:FkbM family methyltransferase